MASLWTKLRDKRQALRKMSEVLPVGFHGDKYLLSLVDDVMIKVDAFIETGTNVGSTARYVASAYAQTPVFSCEPASEAFKVARQTVGGLKNAHLYNMSSPDFLYHIYDELMVLKLLKNLFFLDAHGYGYHWPVRDEVKFVTDRFERSVVIIDDFQVPGKPEFRYHTYDNQQCNFSFIKDSLARGRQYWVIYPSYTEHTSPHHPLVGYVVIAFGLDALPLSGKLSARFDVSLFST